MLPLRRYDAFITVVNHLKDEKTCGTVDQCKDYISSLRGRRELIGMARELMAAVEREKRAAAGAGMRRGR